jgi:HSP20 family protein
MSLIVPKKREGKFLPGLLEDFLHTDRLFDTSLLKMGGNMLDFDNSFVVPEANIIENTKDYRVELAAPGLDKKDFVVEIKDNVLKVSVEKKEEKEEKKENYRRREFCYNSFYRSFTLPENLLTDKVNAKYENGVLHIVLPKKQIEEKRPTRHIEVG